jgi:hypothetical protein
VTDWDDALAKLGLGAAGRFNSYCNRVFQRVEGQVDEFNAATTAVILRAYPVEVINSVQVRVFTGSLDTFTAGQQLDKKAGLVQFRTPPGDGTERVVIDYDGGFWLDDGDAMPADATPLPEEILEAWVMQCQAWAEARNIFGTVSLDKERKTSTSAVQIMEEVKEILNPYRRYAGE